MGCFFTVIFVSRSREARLNRVYPRFVNLPSSPNPFFQSGGVGAGFRVRDGKARCTPMNMSRTRVTKMKSNVTLETRPFYRIYQIAL
jgi:hypothetical protein